MTIASPCVGTCRLDDATGFCIGCARTGEELAAWRDESDHWRAAVWDALPTRFETLGVACRRLPWQSDKIRDFVTRSLGTTAGTWVVGVVGAVAEFSAPRGGSVTVETDGALITASTSGGALRFLIDENVRALTFDRPETPSARQRIVLAVKRERGRLPVKTVLSDLGADRTAVRAEDGAGRLFDLGL
ncbi:MAG: DUF1289 domain-containing protein, partial [Pseudomonadota bacterium]